MAGGARSRRGLSLFIFVLALSLLISTASNSDHVYTIGEDVPLFVSKIGPLNNPSETYWFYDWPFCSPDQFAEKEQSLGEVLSGERLTNSLYELKFRIIKYNETLCEKNLTIEEVAKLRHAVHNNFYFKMLYDDLPFWGSIGKVEDFSLPSNPNPEYNLFTHVKFDVLYNENQVIEVNALADPNYTVDITEDAALNVKFTYSVFWNATSTPFKKRLEKYLESSIFQQIHWIFRIIPLLIIIFVAVVAVRLFLKLKKHLTRLSIDDKEGIGWILLYRDVFRYPCFASMFCAILGTGMQLLTLVSILFLLAFLGYFPPFNEGFVNGLTIVAYALTSVVAAFTAASFRSLMRGTIIDVISSVGLAGILYTGPLFLMAFQPPYMIATSYQATAVVPIGTILFIIMIFFLIAVPSLILGGFRGYAFRPRILSSDAKRVPSRIPSLAWYMRSPCQICLAGFIQYLSFEPDLHYYYASFWSHEMYVPTHFLFLKFIVPILVTAMVSIRLTYSQLSAKDHRWWWRSVLNGGSTSVFLLCRSLVFYAQSDMSGLIQLVLFIRYTACVCFAYFLMLGSISFFASAIFVHTIYTALPN